MNEVFGVVCDLCILSTLLAGELSIRALTAM